MFIYDSLSQQGLLLCVLKLLHFSNKWNRMHAGWTMREYTHVISMELHPVVHTFVAFDSTPFHSIYIIYVYLVSYFSFVLSNCANGRYYEDKRGH